MPSFKIKINEHWFSVEIVGVRESLVDVIVDGEPVLIDTKVVPVASSSQDTSNPHFLSPSNTSTENSIAAPMPGMVLSIQIQLGNQVKAGDVLCTLEAMKMEHEISTPHEGTVKTISVQTGDNVTIGQTLFTIE